MLIPLVFRAVAPFVRNHAAGELTAASLPLLLDHPLVDLESIATVAPPIRFEGEVESLARELSARLRQRGTTGHTRVALVAELTSQARLLASVALDRRLALELGPFDVAAAHDLVSSKGDAGVIAMVQMVDRADRSDLMQTYRAALADPHRGVSRGDRPVWVAWGPANEVAASVCSFLERRSAHESPRVAAILVASRGSASEPAGDRPARRAASMSPVALVAAPFAPVEHPSLGLSLLREMLDEDLRPSIHYLTIPFAETIGPSLYDWISTGQPSFKALVGEWIFAHALQAFRPTVDYLSEVLCADTSRWLEDRVDSDGPISPIDLGTVAELAAAIEAARTSVDRWATELLASQPRVVAFTSVFQQHTASLALARTIKSRRPDVRIVFGGSNCEEEMGEALLASYDFVDVVVSGEAELVFPEVVSRLLGGRSLVGWTGVSESSAGCGERAFLASARRLDLDDLPFARFDDFLEQWNGSSLRDTIRPRLLFESSRGCWWGAKHHCTFCGLNGSSMAFRSKRPSRALEELADLGDRYPGYEIAAVDNILDMKYFPTVVKALAERSTKTSLFYEVKANLTREQIELLKRAGIGHLQPGVESLSDHVLDLMVKGVSALQNVQLIKWCTELGVVPYWNILWGFPGERAEDYAGMREIVPLLAHLSPPSGAGPIRLDRFSPNHFDSRRRGFRSVTATKAYSFIHHVVPEQLDRLAYFFDYEYVVEREPDLPGAILGLWRDIETWRSVYDTSRLVHFPVEDELLVFDTRPCAVEEAHLLAGDAKALFEACDQVRGLSRLAALVGEERAARALDYLVERKLMLRIGDQALSLSLCGRTYDRERSVGRLGFDAESKEE